MSQPVGYSASANGLSWRTSVLWRHSDKTTTVLDVKSTKQVTIEGEPPFYRGTQGGPDANFTHIVVVFNGLPFPCLLGPKDRLLGWSETFRGED